MSGATGLSSTNYVYDANGKQILRRDPNSTTLTIGDAELTLMGGSVTGVRYYSIGGTTVAERTSAGVLSILVPDRQGTDLLAISTTAAQTVTRRQYLPFGQVRGTTVVWVGGDLGYVRGHNDATTSLETLGARVYNPANGRFLSVDPLFEASDPTQMGGYDYSGNDPVTGEDPDGRMFPSGGGPGVSTKGATKTPTVGVRSISPTTDDDDTFEPDPFADPLAPSLANETLTQDDFLQTLKAFSKFSKPWWVNKKMTAMISEVDVTTPDGETESRVVVFINDTDESFIEPFVKSLPPGVKVFMATNGGHAEDAAASFRGDAGLQESELGGTVKSVGNTFTSNNACSGSCANQANYFKGGGDAEDWTAPGEQGSIDGINLDAAGKAQLKTDYGNGRTIDNVIDMLEEKPTIAQQQQAALNAEVSGIVDGVTGDVSVGAGDDETVEEMEEW